MSEEQGKYTTNKQLNLSKMEIEVTHSSLIMLQAVIDQEYEITKSNRDVIDLKALKELNEMKKSLVDLIKKFESLGEEDD